jgi:acyl-coenzyme A synthetase/AMP-(fatty) acid ligase
MELGRVFVPLRWDWPQQRLLQIKNIINLNHMIDEKTFDNLELNNLIEIEDQLLNLKPSDNLYIIFTSGSSGKPKGVIISRKAFEHFLLWVDNELQIPRSNKMLFVADFSFDMSLLDVALFICKKCEVYFSKFTDNVFRLAYEIDKYRINSIATVPNTIDRLLYPEVLERTDISSLHYLLLGGARFNAPTLKKLKTISNLKRLYNFYGPTEATVYMTAHRINFENNIDIHDSNVSIGKPFFGMSCELYSDNNKRIFSPYETGELLISGPQLMEGYIGDDLQTKKVLISKDNRIFYKTGDLSFFDNNNNYYIVGRKDETIKRKGYRINILDIEAYIRAIDGIEDCQVINILDDMFENKIYAFIILNDFAKNKKMNLKLIHKLISDVLVDYQIPDKIIQIDKFPTNNSGKIAREVLKKMISETNDF